MSEPDKPVIEDTSPHQAKEPEKPVSSVFDSDIRRTQKQQPQHLKTILLITVVAVSLIVISINSGIFQKTKKPEPQSKPNYNFRKEPVAASKTDLRLDENWRPTKFVQNDFIDNGDGTVSDRATYLMWKKSGSDKQYSFDKAKEYVQSLNREKFAGYSDWRVPTIEELISLITQDKQSKGKYVSPIFDVQSDYYWSTTTKADYPTTAWILSLIGGFMYGDVKTDTSYVWPVRTISP